jgi:Protein of unknown function (DUF2938)
MGVLEAVAAGVVATVFLDLWHQAVRLVAGLPAGNWALVGRWFAYTLEGRFFHNPIAKQPPIRNELAIGWIFHYAVGIAYGFFYLALLRFGLGIEPSIGNGLIFGIVSVVVPWFFFMPAMGAGVLACNSPTPKTACLQALGSHAVFGLGLAVGSFLV